MGTPQLSFDLPVLIPENAYDYGDRASGQVHGVVLTKPHVVGLMLDLAGHRADWDIARLSLLEPSYGHGAFLVQVVERFMRSARAFGHDASSRRSRVPPAASTHANPTGSGRGQAFVSSY